MEIGDQVKIEINGEMKTGTITSLYPTPKDFDLVQLDVDGEQVTVETDDVQDQGENVSK